MSDYTKIQNWASLTGTSISGTPFDTEFASLAAVSSTKSNKKVPAATNNLASLSGAGDLQDSGVLTSNVVDAVSFHYSTGDIKATAIDSEPTGWLYADGGSHDTSTYSDLFSAIGYTYGGSGANFNVPDLRGRAQVGMDDMGGTAASRIAAATSLGQAGGTETHTLSEAELPVITPTGTVEDDTHTHSILLYGDNSNGSPLIRGTNSGASYKGSGTTQSDTHDHVWTGDSFGSGSAHTVLQPYVALNYLIKT